jgi:FkbH-like protein
MKSLNAEMTASGVVSDVSRKLATAIGSAAGRLALNMAGRHVAIPEVAGACGGVVEMSGGKDMTTSYAEHYVRPLLMLLQGALLEPASAWSAVYLDERARYVPIGFDGAARRDLLKRLIEPDAAEIVDLLAETERPAGLQALRSIHDLILVDAQLPVVRVAFVGDCLMTEIRASLEGVLRQRQVTLESTHDYFSAHLQIVADIGPLMKRIEAGSIDLLALSFLTFEGIPLYTSLLSEARSLTRDEREGRATGIVKIIRNAVDSIRAVSDVPILLHNACGLPLSRVRRRLGFLPALSSARIDVLARINAQLEALAAGVENVMLIDEAAECAAIGLRAATRPQFPQSVTRGALFHTSAFGGLMANAYAPIVEAFVKLRKTKVVCVDFDNTLWSGVMAEGEVVHDLDGQRLLKSLKEAGILLVSVSKNDPKNIRWNEMALAEEDFVLHKISWNQKAQSIEEAAQQLNLGIDSFVLLDDNPAERELVTEQLPAVKVLNPEDSSAWRALSLLLKFPATKATEESRRRTEMYRQAALRREALVGELDYPSMMRGLRLQAAWGRVGKGELDRVAELLQRTNQFNTTTRRQSRSELEALLADPDWSVLSFKLSDKFGSYGIVGIAIVHHAPSAESIVIDSVVMSCRAMGYGFERLLIRAPIDVAIAAVGRKPVVGWFIPTARNDPSRPLFEQSGFVRSGDEAERETWLLSVDDPLPEVADWLAVTSG